MATTRKKTKSACGGKRKPSRKAKRGHGTIGVAVRKPRTRRKAKR